MHSRPVIRQSIFLVLSRFHRHRRVCPSGGAGAGRSIRTARRPAWQGRRVGPTPQALVEKMLDMAKLTPSDYLMDLGSGDGRTVITAAKRGATAVGVEFNPDMVALSKRNAAKENVGERATFVQARPVQDRPVEGDGHHDVPAAEHQHAAAADDPEPQARHAHRVEHLHDGRLGCPIRRSRYRQLLELVHRAAVDRPGQGAGHVEDGDRAI